MKVSVMTPAPHFAADIADVARIFLYDIQPLVNQPGGDLTITHEEWLEQGERVVRVALGEHVFERRDTPRSDALVDKRLHKRQIKLAAFECFRALTGVTPPWGSLTGVRPTRLVYAELDDGAALPDATRTVAQRFSLRGDKAALLEDTVSTQMSLDAPRARDVDIYAGIPFCVSRCGYCSFLSGEVGDGALLAPYVDALARECANAARILEETGLSPRAFYMGGGTPTALPEELLDRALTALDPILSRCREVTCEAGRPDTITRGKLAVLRAHGVSRISVNPQTMHDKTLEIIGRKHTRAQTEEAFSLARQMGFAHINMDVIAGLPGEDCDMFEKTLAWIRAFSPESMTVHALCVKRSSSFHLYRQALPDGDVADRMVTAGRDAARALGMRSYYLYRQKYAAGNLENVGYALPGKECLYNVDMMEETASILAVGAGGISKRLRDARLRIERAPNVADILQYIERVEEMAERKRTLFVDKHPE